MLTATSLWALLKVIVWIGVIFWFFASKLFGPKNGNRSGNLFAEATKIALSGIVIVHGLALLGILDMASLVVSFSAVFLGKLWQEDQSFIRKLPARVSQRSHIFVFDILDGYVSLRELGWRGVLGVTSWVRMRIVRIMEMGPQAVATTFVVVATVGLRMPGFVEYPYPESLREFGQVDLLKSLGTSSIAPGGYYPTGAHALALILRSVTLLDEMLLWKVLGLAMAVVTSVTTFFAVRLITHEKTFGPAVVAAGLSTLFGGSFLLGSGTPNLEFHPWHIAAPFLLMAVVLNVHRMGNPGDTKFKIWSTGAVAAAVLAFVHPLAWVVLLVSVTIASIASKALGFVPDKPFHPVLRVVLGSVPSLLMGGAVLLFRGQGDGLIWRELLAPQSSEGFTAIDQIPMLATAGFAAIVLLIGPIESRDGITRSAPQLLAANYLGLWSLVALPRFGLPQIFSVEGLFILTLPLAAVCIGVAICTLVERLRSSSRKIPFLSRFIKWQSAPAMFALAVLLIVFPPQLYQTRRRLESVEALAAYYWIRDEFVPWTWTVIGHPELVYHVRGYGWHMRSRDFLERYRVHTYQWDPRVPDATIPSEHTFLIVDEAMPYKLALSDIEASERKRENERLLDWSMRYMDEHQDMKVLFQEDGVTVYHIHRTKAVERKIMDQIWIEENGPKKPKQKKSEEDKE